MSCARSFRRSTPRKASATRSYTPKFFTPWTSWTWYITEGSPEDDDFIFFCYVIGQEREWGYSSLNELESIRGPGGLTIERDLHFNPKPRSEIADIE
jgi:hypothetical protein